MNASRAASGERVTINDPVRAYREHRNFQPDS